MHVRLTQVISFVALLGTPGFALARDWHVATGGSGDGSAGAPFGSVQAALDAAGAGDVVIVQQGSYAESLQTQRDGEAAAPIALRAATGADVEITAFGRVLRVDHAHLQVEGLRFDGQYGDRDTLDVNDGAHGLVLRDCEVLRSSRDCVDMGAPTGVLIEGCLIHHCLNAEGGRTDAHGVTGGPVQDLTIRDTEIHSFSGDAIQFDPGREAPGWDNVLVEGCALWLEPLPQAVNGFAAGTVPGENAIDTKTYADGTRSGLVVRDTVAHGFRGGLISNMAAFNLKEEIDARLDGVTVYDSEIALRLRGAGSRPAARVTIANAVIYDVDTAVRYEDDVEPDSMRVDNCTFGLDVSTPFQRASATQDILVVRNLLLLGGALPSEASASSNLAAPAEVFVDAAAGIYRLVPGSTPVNAGETIVDVSVDRDGLARPQGPAYDVGAYELPATPPDAGVRDSAETTDAQVAAVDANASDVQVASADAAQADDPAVEGCDCRSSSRLAGSLLVTLSLAALLLRRRGRAPRSLTP